MKHLIPILLLTFSIQAQVIKVKNENGVLFIPIKINGVLKIDAMIDTGAAECNIPPCIANTLVKTKTLVSENILPNLFYTLADGTMLECKRFLIKSLKIGNKTIYNVECSVSKSDSAPILLGGSALKKLKAIKINYKNNTVTIDK